MNVEHCGELSEVANRTRYNAVALSSRVSTVIFSLSLYWCLSLVSLLDMLAGWRCRTIGTHGGSNDTQYEWPAVLATMYDPMYKHNCVVNWTRHLKYSLVPRLFWREWGYWKDWGVLLLVCFTTFCTSCEVNAQLERWGCPLSLSLPHFSLHKNQNHQETTTGSV